jgi:L-fuculose-phosphate aldolase
VLATAKELARRGLIEGTSGNVSARVDDERICLTPSSLAYDLMTLDDLVVVDLAGKVIEGEASPTTEKSLHLSCYRAYPEIGGVIHSHPVYATMFAVARGTDELGEEVAAQLGDRAAALLANHGMVTVGATAERALHVALVAERTAHIVWGARLLGETFAVPEKVNEDFANVYRFMRDQPR